MCSLEPFFFHFFVWLMQQLQQLQQQQLTYALMAREQLTPEGIVDSAGGSSAAGELGQYQQLQAPTASSNALKSLPSFLSAYLASAGVTSASATSRACLACLFL